MKTIAELTAEIRQLQRMMERYDPDLITMINQAKAERHQLYRAAIKIDTFMTDLDLTPHKYRFVGWLPNNEVECRIAGTLTRVTGHRSSFCYQIEGVMVDVFSGDR